MIDFKENFKICRRCQNPTNHTITYNFEQNIIWCKLCKIYDQTYMTRVVYYNDNLIAFAFPVENNILFGAQTYIRIFDVKNKKESSNFPYQEIKTYNDVDRIYIKCQNLMLLS